MLKQAYTLIALLAIIALNSCGFHLKGHANQGQLSVSEIGLNMADLPPAMQQGLRNTLLVQNIAIVPNSSVSLNLKDYELKQRNLSLEARDRPVERELIASVTYQLTQAAITSAPEQLQARAIYTHDPLNVVSSERERTSLEQQLMQQLAHNIIRTANHQLQPQ